MPLKKVLLVVGAIVIALGAAYTLWEQPKAVGQTVEVYKSPT